MTIRHISCSDPARQPMTSWDANSTDSKRWNWLFVTSLVLLVGMTQTGTAHALDPESTKPYQLEVVLHLSKQRLLTDVFRDKLERELGDGLQEAFGDLARVKVVSKHPRLDDVLSKGLLRALDEWNDRSEIKTHFVLIDYVGEYYEIQARQHDGLTGQASPVVRRDRTISRTLVPKTAALLVAQDFGLVGTVRLPATAMAVKVELKGAGLGVKLDHWVKKDEVFLLVQIPQDGGPAGRLPGRRVPWTVLQVIHPPGEVGPECVCRLFAPNPGPLNLTPGLAGYRCLKIWTGRYPLRAQLIDAKSQTLEPIDVPTSVEVRYRDFQAEAKVRPRVNLGRFDTSSDGEFDHIAFLTVAQKFDVPIPLVSDQIVTIPVDLSFDPAVEQLRTRLDSWVRSVNESLMVQTYLFREIRDLSDKLDKPGQQGEVMSKVKDAIKRSRDEVKQLQSEGVDVRNEANRLKLPPNSLAYLTTSENRVKKIQEGERDLETYLAQLEKNEKEQNDPIRKKLFDEVERARLLIKQAEVVQALEIYNKVIGQGLNVAEVIEEQKKLADLWRPKDTPHGEAREFIYFKWSKKMDLKELSGKLAEAKSALALCIKADDIFGPRKFSDLTVEHARRLLEESTKLNPTNVDDETQREEIQKVSGDLQQLNKEAEEFLQRKAESR